MYIYIYIYIYIYTHALKTTKNVTTRNTNSWPYGVVEKSIECE